MVNPTERTVDGSNAIRLRRFRSFVEHLVLPQESQLQMDLWLLVLVSGVFSRKHVELNQTQKNGQYVGAILPARFAPAWMAGIAALVLKSSPLCLSGSDLPPAPFPLANAFQSPPALFRTEALQR